tara:strand:+ start:2184 stop:2525 length:342 start_codon:yes stop_codon:yes gene_type:complete
MSSLVDILKQWVQIDNDLRKLKAEETKRKKQQKEISNLLIEEMKKEGIDEFALKDGKLTHVKRNIKKPITKKTLLTTLLAYYKDDQEKALGLSNFILENREVVVKESLKREIN